MQQQPITAIPLPATRTRTEWLQQRRGGIGSSDASAILGLSSYASPYSLWEEKTGRAPLDLPVSDRQEEMMEWGNRIEPLVLEATADRLDIAIIKPDHAYRHVTREWQHSNLDGLVIGSDQLTICEFKTTDSRNAKEWVGQIPDHAEIQTHHSAAVTGAENAIVAGLIGGNRLVIHEISINQNIVEIICEAEEKFWDYVTRDTPPPLDGHVKTMQALTRAWSHRPGSQEVAVDAVEPHWEAWAEAAAQEKTAAERKRKALAEITKLMDGHDELSTGKRVWAKAQGGQLNLKRLTADHPGLVDQLTKPSPKFDLDTFKAQQPELYAKYQNTTIRPTTPKE